MLPYVVRRGRGYRPPYLPFSSRCWRLMSSRKESCTRNCTSAILSSRGRIRRLSPHLELFDAVVLRQEIKGRALQHSKGGSEGQAASHAVTKRGVQLTFASSRSRRARSRA